MNVGLTFTFDNTLYSAFTVLLNLAYYKQPKSELMSLDTDAGKPLCIYVPFKQ